MMGSDSDWKGVMEECCRTLGQFGVAYEARVLSAHRTPHAAAEFVTKSEANGVMTLTSVVVFDKGLPGESKQTLECKVQFDPKNAAADPSVIGMTFQW